MSYIVNPYTDGTNRYSESSGTRVLKFTMHCDAWLDPSNVCMMLYVVNDDNAARTLKPIGHCHGFVGRFTFP
jgi:hypothetical protein